MSQPQTRIEENGWREEQRVSQGAVVARLTPLHDDIQRAYKVAGNRTVSVLVPHPNARLGPSPLVAGAGEGPRVKLLRRSRISLRNCCEAVVATITRCYVAQFILLRARPPETRTILHLMWLLISTDVLEVTQLTDVAASVSSTVIHLRSAQLL